MRGMVLEAFGAPLRLRELEKPRPAADEVIIQVRTCGVCGTDVKIANGDYAGIKLPHIPGHEIAGVVVEQGAEVRDLSVGQKVACYFYLFCGTCRNCKEGRQSLCSNLGGRLGFTRSGGFQEYVALPAKNCIQIPQNVPFAEAGIAVDAIATAYHALTTRGNVRKNEWVLVVGAGGVGLHAIQIAKYLSARVLAVDIHEENLILARRHGADETLRIDNGSPYGDYAREISGGDGIDVVLETVVSKQTIGQDVAAIRDGGRLILVGYTDGQSIIFDQHLLVRKELSVVPSRASSKFEIVTCLGLIASGHIRPIIAHYYPLEQLNQALERVKFQ
ncbi:alcohol dehydrogenase catalytic domain-containing protein [Alicyclobacillus kakegawensis]|uniref:alcohol dehydrogenase catalytic domain-containing protein n=1 Tax=Alicyclobacillus kakegawensis TaxID=392012 RepID=UPI0008346C9D|nr:alcohol dehydrogenase catalytic domain-containing protein [Alicyclobacillus kakegawensis]